MATTSKDNTPQNSNTEEYKINSAFTDDPYFKSLLNYNYSSDFNNYHNLVSGEYIDFESNVYETREKKRENERYLEECEFYKEKEWYLTPEQEREMERYENYIKMNEMYNEEQRLKSNNSRYSDDEYSSSDNENYY